MSDVIASAIQLEPTKPRATQAIAASPTAKVGALYWRLEEATKALESRTGSVMGGDGSIFSIRRSLYPDFPDSVLDDLTVSMSPVFAGKRLIRADDVIAFEVVDTRFAAGVAHRRAKVEWRVSR